MVDLSDAMLNHFFFSQKQLVLRSPQLYRHLSHRLLQQVDSAPVTSRVVTVERRVP
jgi:hypothetical protein